MIRWNTLNQPQTPPSGQSTGWCDCDQKKHHCRFTSTQFAEARKPVDFPVMSKRNWRAAITTSSCLHHPDTSDQSTASILDMLKLFHPGEFSHFIFFFTHHSGTASSRWQVATFPLSSSSHLSHSQRTKAEDQQRGQCLLSFYPQISIRPKHFYANFPQSFFLPVRRCLTSRAQSLQSFSTSLSHGYPLWETRTHGSQAPDPC